VSCIICIFVPLMLIIYYNISERSALLAMVTCDVYLNMDLTFCRKRSATVRPISHNMTYLLQLLELARSLALQLLALSPSRAQQALSLELCLIQIAGTGSIGSLETSLLRTGLGVIVGTLCLARRRVTQVLQVAAELVSFRLYVR
jgi:hypothetical protein